MRKRFIQTFCVAALCGCSVLILSNCNNITNPTQSAAITPIHVIELSADSSARLDVNGVVLGSPVPRVSAVTINGLPLGKFEDIEPYWFGVLYGSSQVTGTKSVVVTSSQGSINGSIGFPGRVSFASQQSGGTISFSTDPVFSWAGNANIYYFELYSNDTVWVLDSVVSANTITVSKSRLSSAVTLNVTVDGYMGSYPAVGAQANVSGSGGTGFLYSSSSVDTSSDALFLTVSGAAKALAKTGRAPANKLADRRAAFLKKVCSMLSNAQ